MSLLPHNIPIYENLCNTLEISDKAIIITFTGGGKTYMPLEYLEEHDIHNALVVAPKLSICNEWSDKTDRVTTTTYQTFSKMSVESLCEHPVIIMDEVHHAGSQVWGKKFRALLNEVDPNQTKIIGLTCDDIRWSDGGKSVADEFFKDCIVPGYDIVDALEMGLVNPFTYVCALHELTNTVQKTVTRAKNSPVQKKVIIDRLISRLQFHSENIWNITNILHEHMPKSPIKGIIFCDNIASIPKAQTLITNAYPDIEQFVIHSKLSNDINDERIQAFKNCNEGFCFNINMFGEGMHVNGVNAIIMFRRTQSPAVFFQQIGRGISVGGADNLVIFDIVGNQHTLKTLSARQTKQLNLFKRIESEKPNQVVIHNYAADALAVLQNIEQLLSMRSDIWTPDEDDILRTYYSTEGPDVQKRLPHRSKKAILSRVCVLGIATYKNCAKWSEADDNILRLYYPTEGTKVCDRLSGKTRTQCTNRARVLGLKMEMHNPWTEAEDQILKTYYHTEGTAVKNRLPNRTPSAITSRATLLGIKTEEPKRKWTSDEDAILYQYYPTEGQTVYKRFKNITPDQCLNRAKKLKIKSKRKRAWTEAEDQILRTYYPIEGPAVKNRLTDRTEAACHTRAMKLNINAIQSSIWSDIELDILKEFYPKEGRNVSKRLPNKTKQQCSDKARWLGLKSENATFWTKLEDEILIKYYPTELTAVANRLEGRTARACRDRAILLGIHNKRQPWTAEEDTILRQYYPIEGISVINRLPGKTKTACRSRAANLKLSKTKSYKTHR